MGMSINVLTMFAMVLVIGIVVDDAIVVVENVERIMASEVCRLRLQPKSDGSDFRCGDRYYCRVDVCICAAGDV